MDATAGAMRPLRDLGLAAADLTFGRILARQARRNGDRPYLRFEDRTWSYGEFDRETDRIANGLLDCGVAQGDHVALMLDNGPDILLLQYALGKIGAVACPINTAARAGLLVYFLTHSDAVAMIVGTASFARFAEVAADLPLLRRVVLVGERDGDEPAVATGAAWSPAAALPTGIELLPHAALRGADRPPPVRVTERDPQGIFFTSGTTGPSKGIVATNAQAFGFALGRVEYFGYLPEDVLYTCLPLFHASAMFHAAIAALLADAQLALARRFSARAFWDDIRRHGATQFNLLGSMANILWAQAPVAADREHRARLCGMAPVPAFAPAFEARFGVRIVTSYGLTDFGQGTFLQPGFPAEKFRSAGKARPGVDVEIHDDDDVPVGAGIAGEICLRSGDPVLSGRTYYKMPEATATAQRGGWFHTGDRGYLDADGYLWFVDRNKDAIRRRGENISSWEVEQVIAGHPAVQDVAVFAVGAETAEDEVMATVVLRPGACLTEEELVRHCAAGMTRAMVPRFIEFATHLPRTMSEKVQKRELRASAEARRNDLWDREQAGIVLAR